MRAAEHCPVSILQARGGDAIPEVALWAIDRFVAVTVVPAVEPPDLISDSVQRRDALTNSIMKGIAGLQKVARPPLSNTPCTRSWKECSERIFSGRPYGDTATRVSGPWLVAGIEWFRPLLGYAPLIPLLRLYGLPRRMHQGQGVWGVHQGGKRSMVRGCSCLSCCCGASTLLRPSRLCLHSAPP